MAVGLLDGRVRTTGSKVDILLLDNLQRVDMGVGRGLGEDVGVD